MMLAELISIEASYPSQRLMRTGGVNLKSGRSLCRLHGLACLIVIIFRYFTGLLPDKVSPDLNEFGKLRLSIVVIRIICRMADIVACFIGEVGKKLLPS